MVQVYVAEQALIAVFIFPVTSPVVARENRFCRWVADDGAVYFTCAKTLFTQMGEMLSSFTTLEALHQYCQLRFASVFAWPDILRQYEKLHEHPLARL
jgi:hypothetical protein